MMNRLKQFFYGRYGIDPYSLFLMFASLIFVQLPYVWPVSLGLFVYAVYRAMSKNSAKRGAEARMFNAQVYKIYRVFYKAFAKVRGLWSVSSKRLKERKTSAFVKCPQCKKYLRLPRKKGLLEVTCPVCRKHFTKKT